MRVDLICPTVLIVDVRVKFPKRVNNFFLSELRCSMDDGDRETRKLLRLSICTLATVRCGRAVGAVPAAL